MKGFEDLKRDIERFSKVVQDKALPAAEDSAAQVVKTAVEAADPRDFGQIASCPWRILNYAIQQRFREASPVLAAPDKMPECAILLFSSSMSFSPFAAYGVLAALAL
jgi:hypothetical protein